MAKFKDFMSLENDGKDNLVEVSSQETKKMQIVVGKILKDSKNKKEITDKFIEYFKELNPSFNVSMFKSLANFKGDK